MKKLPVLLICLCLLPLCALAEEGAEIPEGYRIENFGDFTLPVAPNALVTRYDTRDEDGYVAEIRYLDLSCEYFAPYVVIVWHPNNMTEYWKGWHPLDYAKQLWQNTSDAWENEGMVISTGKAVYGQKKGDVHTFMLTCCIEENSLWSSKPHDLWLVERYYGTYDMGTYFFNVYAESRAWADRILADLDRIMYKE